MSNLKALVFVAAVIFALATDHQSHGLKICNVDELNLMKCLPAVTKLNPKAPTSGCCDAIAQLDMQCICSYKSSPLFPMLGIDLNLCLGLPQQCGLPKPACT